MNEYKEWSTEKIVEVGQRLVYLIPIERKRQIHEGAPYWDVLALERAIHTLDALRIEYKKRIEISR